LKAVAHRRNHFLRDQDAVIRQIAVEHGLASATTSKTTTMTKTDKSDKENDNDPQNDKDGDGSDDDDEENKDGKETPSANFSFIVTRATVLLKDGPSTKTLAASKSVRICTKSRAWELLLLFPLGLRTTHSYFLLHSNRDPFQSHTSIWPNSLWKPCSRKSSTIRARTW
jgi:hypothetical protein